MSTALKTEEDYNADRTHIRHSDLKRFAEKGPGYLRALWDGQIEDKDTKALKLGRLIHRAVLEPGRFLETVIEGPEGDWRTKKCQEAIAALKEENPGAEIIKPEDWQRCCAIQQAVHSRRVAHKLLRRMEDFEHTHTWVDREFGSGLKCKRRADARGGGIVLDLKSTEDACPDAFSVHAARYSYPTQLAFYLSGEADMLGCRPDELTPAIIAVEKDPPHRVGVYDLTQDPKWMEVAREWLKRTMGELAARIETNNWKESWDGVVAELKPPRWYGNG